MFIDQKRDIETGNQVGVERRPLPMFPLILTFGIKFEFFKYLYKIIFAGLILILSNCSFPEWEWEDLEL